MTAYENVLKARCFLRRGVTLEWRFNRWITRCISKAVSGCLKYDLFTRVFYFRATSERFSRRPTVGKATCAPQLKIGVIFT